MEPNHDGSRRLYALAGLVIAVLLIYCGLLFDTQVNQYDYYTAQSVRNIARTETVPGSRGIITDRNGRPLVSNRSTYALTFDTSLLRKDQDENEAILRLVKLCQEHGAVWEDHLPIQQSAPFAYTLQSATPSDAKSFLTYLKSLNSAKKALTAYLGQHPELVGVKPDQVYQEEDRKDKEKTVVKPSELLERLEDPKQLTAELLTDAGISAQQLMEWMRESFHIPPEMDDTSARLILGVRYELALRKAGTVNTSYVMVQDISTPFITLLSDGNYAGAKVVRSYVREYETTYAAHILGTVGSLQFEDLENPIYDGYPMNAVVGRSGVEAAFEPYLQGKNGTRVVSTNADGKITGEYYSRDPKPGHTVELTIDEEFQKEVEAALANTISAINAKDHLGATGGAAVVKVGTGEILALASYPTYDPSRYRADYQQLAEDPLSPLVNRATAGTYPPGSTIKPLISIASLEEGIISPKQRINCPVTWYYPGDSNSRLNCWRRSAPHGKLNVTDAIAVSCNYFFAEMGYQLGMERIQQYMTAFGFGQHTGIEIGEKVGSLPENPPGQDQAPWAAIGQSTMLATPLQLANYTATLAAGGQHNEAHLLKAVKTYDNSAVVALGNTTPVSTVPISPSSLDAVKKGMHQLTKGSLAPYFKNCIVEAGAKTGTAQLGGGKKNNGVFICFAPYDDPEIAVAVAIEKGGAGAALANTAVNILNAYFSAEEIGSAVLGEQQLLP